MKAIWFRMAISAWRRWDWTIASPRRKNRADAGDNPARDGSWRIWPFHRADLYALRLRDTAELIELCKVVAEFDGVFVLHQRSEADAIWTR